MAKKKTTKKSKSRTKAKSKSKSSGASTFMAHLRPSDALGAVIGYSPMPRTQAVKKLWAYIKKHKLQDKKNKRTIQPDEKLAEVFGSLKGMNMFTMMKVIKKHLKKT